MALILYGHKIKYLEWDREGAWLYLIIGNEVIQNILIKSVFDKLLKMKIVSVSQVTQCLCLSTYWSLASLHCHWLQADIWNY